jgi:hypothetical protein
VTKPSEAIPLSIEVAITTESEKDQVHCPNILIYDWRMDPSVVIEEILRIIHGKQRYNNLIIGIDPGKALGMAVLGDGIVLETKTILNEKDSAMECLRLVERFKGEKKVVKIGNGAKGYRSKLLMILDEKLPHNVDIELVEERGTTKNIRIHNRNSSDDASSAINISIRNGHKLVRGR